MVRPEPQEPDTIHDLEKKLYRRQSDDLGRERTGFTEAFSREGVPALTESGIMSDTMAPRTKSRFSFVSKLFMGSFVFFLAALGVAVYLFFSGTNVFSLENIDLSVSGPVAIEGGKDLTLQVALSNKNSVDLQLVDFVVEYPNGTRDPSDTSKSLTNTREFLDIVQSGQVINKTVRAVLFGEENTEKTIKVKLEFRVPNSNTIFTKEKDYTLSLTSSPVGLTLTVPKESVSNDAISLDVSLGSNSDAPVRGVLLALSYPPGFSFTSADPAPAFGDSVWSIGDLAPGQKRSIHITGVLEGQNDETKAFKASVGTKSSKADDTLGTIYTSVFKTLSIQRPQLALELALGGARDETVVAAPQQSVGGDIAITNNLPDQITSPKITVRFVGDTLDKETIQSQQGGFYQSSDNSIVWNESGNKDLDVLAPGDTKTFHFSFASLSPASSDFPKTKNPDMTIEVSVSGTRLSPGRAGEEIETVVKRRIKLSSLAQLSSRLVYSIGPFKNTGPLPPQADKPTTYTVIWSVANLSSDLTGATVEATLPQYVQWVGTVSPTDEKVTFNGGKVSWNIGGVKAGTGVTTSAREASFQVIFKPSLAQVGSGPVLVSDATLRATDDFAGTPVQVSSRALTTSMPTDPNFTNGQAQVIK